MARYVTGRPETNEALGWWDIRASDSLARTVHEGEPVKTGIVDTAGNPIWRLPDRIGFVRRD